MQRRDTVQTDEMDRLSKTQGRIRNSYSERHDNADYFLFQILEPYASGVSKQTSITEFYNH